MRLTDLAEQHGRGSPCRQQIRVSGKSRDGLARDADCIREVSGVRKQGDEIEGCIEIGWIAAKLLRKGSLILPKLGVRHSKKIDSICGQASLRLQFLQRAGRRFVVAKLELAEANCILMGRQIGNIRTNRLENCDGLLKVMSSTVKPSNIERLKGRE